jgi:hypothetical protein
MNFTRRQTIFKYTNQAARPSAIVLTDLMPYGLTWSKAGIALLPRRPARPFGPGL